MKKRRKWKGCDFCKTYKATQKFVGVIRGIRDLVWVCGRCYKKIETYKGKWEKGSFVT